MTFAGGDPDALTSEARMLTHLGDDIRTDALRVVGLGKEAGGLAGDGGIGDAIIRATSAIGGVLNGSAILVDGLAGGAVTQADQLRRATGSGR
ncbi:hypothetical protein [Serinicoccus marinus]|uniref:hypothetical protein n=1 Tax=Serinicoccus marinus TaxID=247333 RepID=UPI002493A87E|nr:hypothetical protein [Serinicoccus marinus]